jgi:hypothetical protein
MTSLRDPSNVAERAQANLRRANANYQRAIENESLAKSNLANCVPWRWLRFWRTHRDFRRRNAEVRAESAAIRAEAAELNRLLVLEGARDFREVMDAIGSGGT